MKRFISAVLFLVTLTGCARLGISPTVSVEPDRPVLAANLEPYFEKRAVVLAFKEPVSDDGVGFFFANRLFTELLDAGPFRMVGNASDKAWFHFDPRPSQEFSTAAAIANDLGYDVAVIGEVDRFAYSRNSESQLIVNVSLLDTTTGQLLHQQRLIVRGHVGYLPPLWDPSNYKPVDKEDLFLVATRTLVRRMHVRWWEGETEADYFGYDEEESDDEGVSLDEEGGS